MKGYFFYIFYPKFILCMHATNYLYLFLSLFAIYFNKK